MDKKESKLSKVIKDIVISDKPFVINSQELESKPAKEDKKSEDKLSEKEEAKSLSFLEKLERKYLNQISELKKEIEFYKNEIINQKNLFEKTVEDEKKNSYLKGKNEGINEGKSLGYNQLKNEINILITSLQKTLEEINKKKENIAIDLENDILELLILMLKKIIRTELKVNKESLKFLITEMMSLLGNTENIVVRVNPNNLNYLRENREEFLKLLQGIKNFDFEADYSITEGGCVIEVESGKLDGRLESQLEILINKLYETRDEHEIS